MDPSLQSTSMSLPTRNQPAVPSSLLSLGAHGAQSHQLSSRLPSELLSALSMALGTHLRRQLP